MAAWRLVVQIAAGVSWSYHGSQRAHVFAGPPITLDRMLPHHQEAWRGFIREAARSREARREFSTLTGAAALALVAKQNQPSYGRIGPGPYVPLLGEAIAEPSRPCQVVPLLKALPVDWSQLYSCESNLLRTPPPEQSQLENLNRLAQKIGGSKAEYVK